jgi:Ca2+/H+ antiporter, TMEM165/GDT1 family
LSEFFLVFGLIFVAELGDKSQFLVLWYATRYHWWVVIAGMATAVILLQLVAVIIGQLIGLFVPEDLILLAGGVLFFGFAAWSLYSIRNGNGEEGKLARTGGFGVFFLVGFTFFLSEFGDKTQILTLSLSARSDHLVAVWLGSSAAMITVNVVAVAIGLIAGKRVPRKLMAIVAAVLFFGFGVASIAAVIV